MHQYFSVTRKVSSKPNNGSYGSTNTVFIKNGKGYKLKEILGKDGKVLRQTKKNLNRKEMNAIVRGKFVPGIWQGLCE